MSRLFGWDLPPGVTDSMCEPYDPVCGRCGCNWSAHYSNDMDLDIYERAPLNAECDFEYMAEELDSNGEVVHACDSLLKRGGKDVQCECTGFIEGEFEPEWEPDEY